jgi:hypothetical protein
MKIQIGQPLKLQVLWYDRVPEPPRSVTHDGEVVGWRDSQVLIRVRDYAVLRFWKRTGLEVGNPDNQRRGFSVDLSQITESARPEPGSNGIPIAIDTDA